MDQPLISVIIPTYNRFRYIGETLDSLIGQTYRNWECIVVDDGSDDYTDELLSFYSEKDERIQYYHRPINRPKGANACRNFGFEVSTGEYIQWLDSDDIISPEKFEVQLKLLIETNADLATCKWGRFANGAAQNVFENLLAYNHFSCSYQFLNALADSTGYFPNHTYLARRRAVIRAGTWFEYLSVNQDGEFMIRVIANSDQICFSKEAKVFYRWRIGVNTSVTNEKNISDLINSWRLIEAYLKIRYNTDDSVFMTRTKERLFLNCKALPGVVKENKDFFKEQIRKEPTKLTSWLHNYLIKVKVGRIILRPLKKLRRKIYG